MVSQLSVGGIWDFCVCVCEDIGDPGTDVGGVWSLCAERGVGVFLGWWPYFSKGEIFRL